MRLLTTILISAIAGTSAGVVWGYLSVVPAASTNLARDPAAPAVEVDDKALPKVVVDQQEHNFGKMKRGTSRSHTFVISNEGGAPLRLTMGQPSCKCTVGALDKNVLQPGESLSFDLKWDAQGDEGPFRQWVPFTTNDPRNSNLELSVVGEITRATGLYPQEFSFGRIPVGEDRTAQVTLMAYLQDSVEVDKAVISGEAEQQFFAVSIESLPVDKLPDEKAAAGVRITVTAKSGLPLGRFGQWLELETNLTEMSELKIPILGQVVGDISIAGRNWSDEHGVLKLGQVVGAKGVRADLNVIVRGEHAADVAFEVAQTEPAELVATLGEPKRYKDTLFHVPLTIEIPAGTRPMLHLNPNLHEPARVTLKSTHPQAPELVLEVRFAVEG